jgi:hypothetical protein
VIRLPILVGLASVEESPSSSPSLCLSDSLLQLPIRLSVLLDLGEWIHVLARWLFFISICKHMASYLFALVSSIFTILHHSYDQTHKLNQTKLKILEFEKHLVWNQIWFSIFYGSMNVGNFNAENLNSLKLDLFSLYFRVRKWWCIKIYYLFSKNKIYWWLWTTKKWSSHLFFIYWWF